MRCRRWFCTFLVCALIFNVLLVYYFWRIQSSLSDADSKNERAIPEAQFILPKNVRQSVFDFSSLTVELVTIIIREFEEFENDLIETVLSVRRVFKSSNILVVTDKLPYPPIHFPNISNFELISLHTYPEQESIYNNPVYHIHTPYVAFIPDGIRMKSSSQLLEMVTKLKGSPDSVLVAPVTGERSWCYRVDTKIKEWTVKKSHAKEMKHCNVFEGSHVVLLSLKQLLKLSESFARPFPYSLFVQASIKKWKVHFADGIYFQHGKALFLDTHKQWKKNSLNSQRLVRLYSSLGIKKVIQPNEATEWYGCKKDTSRCFGTVIDDIPEYLYEGRWTPPCCLEALRITARHTLHALQQSNVRHWLEGGSLLGAARKGDVIPWDYDVDIGIYRDDIVKSKQLTNALKRPYQDEQGFVWEKATDGDFFRVQFSKTNHMHVDIFPFYSKAGIMTKNTWFKTHPQDKEFPEHFLRPLTTIDFVGIKASAPNNIRDFLELKFGEGVIENPKYPAKLQFVNVTHN